MKRFLPVLLLFLAYSCAAQTSGDSLWSIWNNQHAIDSVRLKAIHTLAKKKTLYANPDSAFSLAAMQLHLALSVGNHKYAGEALNTQGISWAVRGRLDSAMNYFHRALSEFEKGKLLSEMAGALYNSANTKGLFRIKK